MARHFSEEEARRIFARAAERQHRRPALGEGLTLEDLQAIGREAGIDPAHVAAAAAEDATPYQPPMWAGVPLRTQRVRRLVGPVDDAAWGRVLDVLRERHQTPGAVEHIGDRRSWTAYEGSLQGERVRIETTSEGTELTVESGVASEKGAAYGLSGMMVSLGALMGVGGAATGKTGLLWFALAMAVMTVAVLLVTRVSARRRAGTRPLEMDALADRIERIAASSAPSLPNEAPGSRLDPLCLDAGPEVGEVAPQPRSRTRT